jgi:hypothetical protein
MSVSVKAAALMSFEKIYLYKKSRSNTTEAKNITLKLIKGRLCLSLR